jgi:hypothetical protein
MVTIFAPIMHLVTARVSRTFYTVSPRSKNNHFLWLLKKTELNRFLCLQNKAAFPKLCRAS